MFLVLLFVPLILLESKQCAFKLCMFWLRNLHSGNSAIQFEIKIEDKACVLKTKISHKIIFRKSWALKCQPMLYFPAKANKSHSMEWSDVMSSHFLTFIQKPVWTKRLIINLIKTLTARKQTYIPYCIYNKWHQL